MPPLILLYWGILENTGEYWQILRWCFRHTAILQGSTYPSMMQYTSTHTVGGAWRTCVPPSVPRLLPYCVVLRHILPVTALLRPHTGTEIKSSIKVCVLVIGLEIRVYFSSAVLYPHPPIHELYLKSSFPLTAPDCLCRWTHARTASCPWEEFYNHSLARH